MKIKLSVESKKKCFEIIENCIGCKKCVSHCKMLKTYTETPNVLFAEEMTAQIPFSCQLCGYCQSICPRGIDLKAAFYSIRQDTQDQKKIKTPWVDFHQKNSFSPFFSSKLRSNKKVFFPGCSLTANDPEMVMNLYDHIKDEDMCIWTSCCGNPTYSLGKTKTFSHQLTYLNHMFESKGVVEVIVACQNCYKIFKEHTSLKVTSIFEVLSQLPLPVTDIKIKKSMVLHDPCPTRKYAVVHQSVREILAKLSLDYTEYDYNRSFTQCCGSGAMVNVTNKKITQQQAKHRALQSEADAIITYCQECVESLSCEKETFHLLNILFGHGVKKNKVHTIKKWTNRRLMKVKIDRIK